MGGKRRRLPADEARSAILDVAESHLARRGPDGIRLEQIAAELGISHPAILHHFGSKAGLVRAVVTRSVRHLERDIVASLAEGAREDVALDTMRRVLDVLGDRGHARILAWLYLTRGDENDDPIGFGDQLRRITEVVYRVRKDRLGDAAASYEDTLFTVTLSSMALFGHAITTRAMRENAGIDDAAFLRWLTHLLFEHLESPA